MATLTVTNLNLTFTTGLNATTTNPNYSPASPLPNPIPTPPPIISISLGVAGYQTISGVPGNTTIDTTIGNSVYTTSSDMSFNNSFLFTLALDTFIVNFTMTSSSSAPGVVYITNILINGTTSTSNVTNCTLTYLPPTTTTGPGYQLQYYSSNGSTLPILVDTDTVIYTTPNDVATYTYTQTVPNDTLLYFDTLMLGINAIYDALAESTRVIPEYAGFIDLAMSGLYNLSTSSATN